MIAHVAGVLEDTRNNQVIIDVNGIGYEILVSANVLKQLPPTGEFLKVYTYQLVREDELSLFGFQSSEEKEIFQTLLSVSGIGGKTALNILSSIDKDRLVNAILTGDLVTLTSLPGIGKKSAERMVLELKDKMGTTLNITSPVRITTQNTKDTIDALGQLGYNSREISRALTTIEADIKPDTKVEEIIKNALKYL
ncbi:MAG: Holliday junction branch migration protein RuvA [Candidatus Margulisiibacteriota bacterium]